MDPSLGLFVGISPPDRMLGFSQGRELGIDLFGICGQVLFGILQTASLHGIGRRDRSMGSVAGIRRGDRSLVSAAWIGRWDRSLGSLDGIGRRRRPFGSVVGIVRWDWVMGSVCLRFVVGIGPSMALMARICCWHWSLGFVDCTCHRLGFV